MNTDEKIPVVHGSEARQQQRQEKDFYCCALCENTVTSTDQAVTRDGNHYHDRTNPEGLRFLLACFSQAPGCEVDGIFSTEHSWFSSCAWAVARCNHCQSQLGWFFRGQDDFFGLIVDRLFLRQGNVD